MRGEVSGVGVAGWVGVEESWEVARVWTGRKRGGEGVS
jgi:hypothetical protein